MATDRSNDVRAFRDFLDERLSHGAADLTLDEALGLWEIQTQQPAMKCEETHQSLSEARDDRRTGDTGTSVRQFQTGARHKSDRPGTPRVPASSRARAEVLGEMPPSCGALRRARWLD